MNLKNVIAWVLRLVAAVILLQTLYFKFTAHPQSVYIFTTIGMEPWGRIGTGVMELIASVLILFPRTTAWGAGLGMGLMAGAIYFHLTKLGIEVDGDVILFLYAVIVFICCFILLILFKQQVLNVIKSRSK